MMKRLRWLNGTEAALLIYIEELAAGKDIEIQACRPVELDQLSGRDSASSDQIPKLGLRKNSALG